jgi:hypothetical protein
MNIEDQIKYLELNAKRDLDDMSPKDRMMYYQNIKQFEFPKYQNRPFLDLNENQKDIKIEIVKYESN